MQTKIGKITLTLLFLSLTNLTYAKLEIIIKSSPDWGDVSDADVEYLCQEIVDRFEEHLRPENEINTSVNVSRTTVGYSFLNLDLKDPRVKYKINVQMGEDMEIIMEHLWDFIIRFGHEFTHILQVEQEGLSYKATDNVNLWFQEAIAQMGCVWVMKSMADAWKDGSRFGKGVWESEGLAEFSENFDFYADWYMDIRPYRGTAKQWLERYEDQMRKDYEQGIAEQLGYKLLSIFENDPKAWNAIRKMPLTSTEKMSKYMQVWYDSVDFQDREYVQAIAEIMGISVISKGTIPIIASTDIDADIDNNGFVDLSDVLLVRSAMQNTMPYDTDVNNDGITNEIDLLLVKQVATAAIVSAAPSLQRRKITTWGALKQR